MSRHGNLKHLAEDLDEEEDEFDEETEYAIDRVLTALRPRKLKREKVYDLLLRADFDVEGLIEELKQGEKAAKKLATVQPPAPRPEPSIEIAKAVEPGAKGRIDSTKAKAGNSPYPDTPSPLVDDDPQARESLNVGVFGAVDAGKSTLLGHLFAQTGALAPKELQRAQSEAQRCAKSSFAYAFTMDEMAEERERGITIEIGDRSIDIDDRRFNFLDTPGHADFVTQTLRGAALADVAVLLVDAVKFSGSFEGGPTVEHLDLLRGQNVRDVLVAVNKMDAAGWDAGVFHAVKTAMERLLAVRGADLDRVAFVPVSAFAGENLVAPKQLAWYAHGSFLHQLLRVRPPASGAHRKPLRVSVLESFRGCATKRGLGVHAKLEGGVLVPGQRLLAAVSGARLSAKALYRREQPVGYARAGDIVDVVLQVAEEDFELLRRGEVLCAEGAVAPCARRFRAVVTTHALRRPMLVGSRYTLHLALQSVSVVVRKIALQLAPERRPRPRLLLGDCTAELELQADAPLAVETAVNFARYGAFQLCEGYRAVAFGAVEELIE